MTMATLTFTTTIYLFPWHICHLPEAYAVLARLLLVPKMHSFEGQYMLKYQR